MVWPPESSTEPEGPDQGEELVDGPAISLALVIHNHQPVGNFGWVIEDTFRTAYEPMLAVLERHPGIRVGLHYSGPLLEWLVAEQPQAVERLGGPRRPGPGRDPRWRLDRTHPCLVAHRRPHRAARGAWATSSRRALAGGHAGPGSPSASGSHPCPHDLVRGGYEWTILDDNHLRGGLGRRGRHVGHVHDRRPGERLTVFGTEQGLRYRIPFGRSSDLIGYLREHATDDGRRLGMMGDDGEKFGAWPTTYEHCWGEGRWVDRCFEALEANADWLTTTTPSDWLEREPPVGRIYVPAASYVEMTEWALPAGESGAFHECWPPRELATARRRASCGAGSGATSRRATARSTTCTSRCCARRPKSPRCPRDRCE